MVLLMAASEGASLDMLCQSGGYDKTGHSVHVKLKLTNKIGRAKAWKQLPA
jgi:hypothetical protein